jgi:hypothetical protein
VQTKTAWVLLGCALFYGCQSQCRCPAATTPTAEKTALAEPEPEPEPAQVPAPVATAGESSGGFVEIEKDGKLERVSGACGRFSNHQGDGIVGPFAEVIDPATTKPRFVLASCGATEVYFDIVGTTVSLPGSVQVMRARFEDPGSGQEWTSETAKLEVTEFGAVGERVKGTFEAKMGARLNQPAQTIRGRFDVPRSKDRFSP